MTERNPYHLPAGTPEGGEFTTGQLGIIENAARKGAGLSSRADEITAVFKQFAPDTYEIKSADIGQGWIQIRFKNRESGFVEQSVNIKIDSAGDVYFNDVYIPESMRGKGYMPKVLKGLRELPGMSGIVVVDVPLNPHSWDAALSHAGFTRIKK